MRRIISVALILGGLFMYNRVQVKLEAKQALSRNFGTALGVLIVGSVILGIASVVSFLLAGVIAVGYAIVYLEIVRGWKLEFADMFKGFNNFGTNCLAGILIAVYTFLWSLLFVIPGIVKAYSYAMTPYVLADHPEMSASDAISASRVIMDGHKWDLFVLQLSFFWWILLCGVTFGIAYIYVGPYMAAAEAKFYDTIKDEKTVQQPAGEPQV